MAPRPIGLSKARAAKARTLLLNTEELLREYRADQSYRAGAMRVMRERNLAAYHDHRVHETDDVIAALAQLRADLQMPGSVAQFLTPTFSAEPGP